MNQIKIFLLAMQNKWWMIFHLSMFSYQLINNNNNLLVFLNKCNRFNLNNSFKWWICNNLTNHQSLFLNTWWEMDILLNLWWYHSNHQYLLWITTGIKVQWACNLKWIRLNLPHHIILMIKPKTLMQQWVLISDKWMKILMKPLKVKHLLKIHGLLSRDLWINSWI